MSPTSNSSRNPVLVRADEILKTEMPPLYWIVHGLLPEGFSVLGGRQKLGKTTLAQAMAAAVAMGVSAFGRPAAERGDVLYIDLENGRRRVRNRLLKALELDPDAKLDFLAYWFSCAKLDGGLIEQLEEWRLSCSNPRLVVIDVLQAIKPAGRANRTAYENDYDIWRPLKKWAEKTGVAVLGLHHTRKQLSEDPLESLSGSNGLSACADTCLILDLKAGSRTLYIRGRDVEECRYLLDKRGQQHVLTPMDAAMPSLRPAELIRSYIDDAKGDVSVAEIVAATGVTNDNARQVLSRLVKDGLILRPDHGRYTSIRLRAN